MGKVNCKNMKQDCPVPACPRATLLPGHCCRTCPKGEESLCFPLGAPARPPGSPLAWKRGHALPFGKGCSICYKSHQCL